MVTAIFLVSKIYDVYDKGKCCLPWREDCRHKSVLEWQISVGLTQGLSPSQIVGRIQQSLQNWV